MPFCKSRLTQLLLLLALCLPVPLMADEETEPFYGLWQRAPRGEPDDGLFLYRAVLRYRARAVPRAGGFLPEPFRAAEDSLGLFSDRFDDFLYLQDSLALGGMPPQNLPMRARSFAERQISALIDSGEVEAGTAYQGTPVHPTPRIPASLYLERMTRKTFRSLWAEEAERTLLTTETGRRQEAGVIPALALPVEMPGAIRSIVGSGQPNLQVSGSERISFSGTSRWYPDRPITEFQRRQSKFPQLDMKQELNLKLTGNIGDKVSVDVDQSSQASTPLANRIQIHYAGYEDEILQRVELGNTSLRLPGTQYVSYSGRHEGLFGINAEALLGEMQLTGILSKQEGKNETKSITKGAELRTIEIEDWRYRGGKFFFLTDPNGPPLVDLDVASVEVWVDDRNGANNNEQLTLPAIVTRDGDKDALPPDSLRGLGDFNQLVANEDYIVQTDVYTGYPVLILGNREVLDGRMTKALAVRYDYRDAQGSLRRVGGFLGTDPDTLVLKLIRPAAEMGGTNPLNLREGIFSETRHLELRNIYDLGSNLSSEGLEIRIRRRGVVNGISSPDRIGEHTFLEILGLDLYTAAGQGEQEVPGPDGKIDDRRIDLNTGYVIFRELHPFAPTVEDSLYRIDHTLRPFLLPPDLRVPEIYLRNDWSGGNDPNLVSRYLFEVRARSVASRISLGFNLLQGSEQVTAGGRTLIRDRDYTIDYDTGEIEILEPADVTDTDEIRVSYSYLPFGGGGQKTLIGSALRYAPPESKAAVSTTWVYESKGSPGVEGRRPRLGQEPTRTIVGELAGSYRTDSWGLTSLIDAIPGISTRQRSSLTMDAGMGLSFPNPNTRGELYIDDFEGAKDEFLVTMNRLGWRPSGIPRAAPGGTSAQQASVRGEAWWYSPRNAVKEGDLQPTDSRSGGLADTEKDNNRTVLEMHFFPNGATPEQRRSSWFSLVQPLSTRGLDLSRAQFLDLWVNDYIPADRLEERSGTIHLEIGVVSEDAIWKRVRPEDLGPDSFEPPNGRLDTEDLNRDGELDDPGGGQGEDVGLDGLTDAEEGTGEDPAFDNWEFVDSDEAADRREPKDDPGRTQRYARINGTQGNGRLDTEDLNGNLILDVNEAYFHYSVDLADTSLVEYEASAAPDQDPAYASYTRGWRRVRIPLTSADAERIGSPSWEQVRHLRLWVEGFEEETYLQIGGIEITGNRWLKGAVRDAAGRVVPDSLLLANGEDFFPAVLNNKDNSTAEYTPPFEPRERQDVEEREQSLTLEMINFQAGHSGTVFRTYNTAQDLANLYGSLEFYLNRRIREGPTPDLDFFIRLCRDAATDTTNFYEFRVPVTDGWRLVEVDLEEISRLQLDEGCRSDSCDVSAVLPDGGMIRRKGNPNLTSVWRIAFGVVNRGPTAVVSGNVWVNELRLTDVKRDAGVASRFGVGLVMADLASLNFNFQKTGADFLRIGSEVGSGKTVTSYGLNSRMNSEKFLEGTGINLPLTFSMARSKTVPKFQSDSDLVLEEATDRDIAESKSKDVSFSLSRARSRNPWIRSTIDAFSLSGRLDQREDNNPWSRVSTSGRSGSIQYSLPLGGGPALRLYRKTDLHLLPTSFLVGVSGDVRKTTEFSRNDGDINQSFVAIPRAPTRSGRLNWSTGMRPLEQVTYNFDQTRDLRLMTANKSLFGVNLGTETSRRHKLSASQQINLAGLGLLPKGLVIVPKVSWNGNFDGTFNMIRATGQEGGERTNRFSNSSSTTISGGLPIGRLLQMLSPFGRGGGPGGGAEEDTAAAPRAVRSSRGGAAPGGGGLLTLGAVSATYTIGKSNSLEGIRGDPSIGYQLGWTRDPGPDAIRSGAGTRATSGDRKDLNLSTDLKILREISIRTTYIRSVNLNSVNGGESENRTRKFPDLSVNWGRIHTKLGLDRFAREMRASTSYSRSVTETITGAGQGNERIRTAVSLNPLLNVDASLKNGVSAKLTSSYDKDVSEQRLENISNVTTNLRRRIGVTLSRSINLSRMVTNPITKKRNRVTSKLDLSLSGNYSENESKSRQGGREVPGRHNLLLDLSSSAGYNFTSSISGNASLSFSQNTDKKNRANTVRSVSVTVSAAFRF